MGLDPADLAGVRATISEYLPSVSTNSRTGLSRNCRVTYLRDRVLRGLPEHIQVPEWVLKFADGDAVTAGDIETESDKGSYAVLEVLDPADYSVSIDAIAVRLLPQDDGSLLPFAPTHIVTLTSKKAGIAPLQDVPCLLGETDAGGRLDDEAVRFPWTVVISDALAYEDGSRPQQGDSITWERRSGVPITSTLGKSHPPRNAYLPVWLFAFKEAD